MTSTLWLQMSTAMDMGFMTHWVMMSQCRLYGDPKEQTNQLINSDQTNPSLVSKFWVVHLQYVQYHKVLRSWRHCDTGLCSYVKEICTHLVIFKTEQLLMCEVAVHFDLWSQEYPPSVRPVFYKLQTSPHVPRVSDMQPPKNWYEANDIPQVSDM